MLAAMRQRGRAHAAGVLWCGMAGMHLNRYDACTVVDF